MSSLKKTLFCLFIFVKSINAQTLTPKTDSLQVNNRYKNSFLVAPLVSNTPETGWAFALAGVYIFKTNKKDTVLRSSTMPLGVAYTTRNQILIALGATIYLPKENYIISLENSYSKFPDKFWGIGNNTDNRNFEHYTFTQFYLNPKVYRRIIGKYYAGIGLEFQQVLALKYDANSYFETDNILGRTPYKMAGIGILMRYDNRNHAYMPDRGGLANLEIYNAEKWNGSDYSFVTIKLEVRKFQKIFKKHVLAFHMRNIFTFGDVPYRSLAVLGGNDIMRGYYSGRFRDKMGSAMQIEYRFPIWWRFGGVAFAGMGEVSNHFSDYSFERLKYSIGTGARFSLLPKEKLNLRFDVGWGNNNSFNYYVIIAESF